MCVDRQNQRRQGDRLFCFLLSDREKRDGVTRIGINT
jgi:hypothetical protein